MGGEWDSVGEAGYVGGRLNGTRGRKGEVAMKRTELLNSEISYVISRLGHTQQLTIGDAGLPIPEDVKRIDLALVKGVSGFLQTLDAVLCEMQVEGIILAEEIREGSPEMEAGILKRFPDAKVQYVPHEMFKEKMKESRAVIRTGETTAFANVILVSGVTF